MGDIALSRIRKSGVKVDRSYAKKLHDNLQKEMDRNAAIMASYGLIRGQKGFKTVYSEIIDKLQLDLPRTEKTNMPSMAAEHLIKYKGIHFVDALLDFLELEKRKSFIDGLQCPYIHPRYNSLINTLRTSCSKINIQQLPRKGDVREALIPEHGYIFIDADYDVAELCAMAQITYELFGHSKMRDIINSGDDIHKSFACEVFNKDIKDITKEERQFTKVPNFGFVADMSPATYVDYAKGIAGIDISVEDATKLKKKWVEFFPEMQKYWDFAKGKSGCKTKTGFIRGNCSYTARLNTPMQSRVAEGAKIALYNLLHAGYDVKMFIHDQVVIQYKGNDSRETIDDINRIMVASMGVVIPDVNISVDAQVKERFCK